MNITMTKKALLEGLTILERVIPARSSNPIVTTVKLTVTPTTMTAEGTNLEIDMQSVIPCEADQAGTLVLPMHLFTQVIRNMGADIVTMTVTGTVVNVKAGGSQFELQANDATAFPTLSFDRETTVEVQADAFAAALKHVKHAASTESFQAVFRGVKLEFRERSLRCVASDGYRVALSDISDEGLVVGEETPRDVIVPSRSADELTRLLNAEADGGMVEVGFADGVIFVRGARGMMTVKLLDGDFPDYERVMPKTSKVTASVDGDALLKAVNTVAIMSDKNANNRVEVTVSKDRVLLETHGDYGRGSQTVDGVVTLPEGQTSMALAFNARHLIDALSQVNGPACLTFNESITPAVVSGVTNRFLGVLVTLRE